MRKRFIDGNDFYHMVLSGAQKLLEHVDDINALNVFPVPDGDTGTNMNMTMTSGVEEMKKQASDHLGKTAEALSKGLLMGARGNSGVILSQLFRGFAKSVSGCGTIDTVQFAAALQQGVVTAYNAVVKPVEGTILTVSKEAAKRAVAIGRSSPDMLELMRDVQQSAKKALARTPEQLPVLKQVGVVDSGGQGLVFIYEGFIAGLSGEDGTKAAPNYAVEISEGRSEAKPASERSPMFVAGQYHSPVQAKLSAEHIEFGYCTEFLVKLVPDKTPGVVFDENQFRKELQQFGDSLLVVSDDDLVKVHIHAEYPGSVMNEAMKFGDLSKIKIENMREQHAHIVDREPHSTDTPQPAAQTAVTAAPTPAAVTPANGTGETAPLSEAVKPYGIVAIGTGDGIGKVFRSWGVDVFLSGGQTMNPSTEHIVQAIVQTKAKQVFVLPNNGNIIMAAKQAAELAEAQVEVIPTKTVPQGLAAALTFKANVSFETNTREMQEAAGRVRTGQVTYAVRDSQIGDVSIKQGDYIGMLDNQIVTAGSDLLETCKQLLDKMIVAGDEMLTVLSGEDTDREQVNELTDYVENRYPDVEADVFAGGQPLYYYIFSVE